MKDKALNICLLLFGLFPLIPGKLKGLPVIILIITSFLFFLKKKKKRFDVIGFCIFSSLYIISFLSIFYTSSYYFPWDKIETTLSLFIIPLSFFLIGEIDFIKIDRAIFHRTFIYSTGILTLLCLIYYAQNNLFDNFPFKVNSFRALITKIPFVNDHPIYVSLFLGIALLLCIDFYKGSSRTEKRFIFFAGILNLVHMFLLSSKGVIIGFTLAIIVYVLVANKSFMARILVSFTIVLFVIGSILLFPNLERRFREFVKKTTYTELRMQNSSSIRLAIFKCTIEKIKEKPLFGYGWGKGNIILKECYKTRSEQLLSLGSNSHNQFLGYYLDGGIFAFGVLVFFLIYLFKHAIANKDNMFLAILVLFVFILNIENILVRQSGVILFIFIMLFYRFTKKNAKDNLINQ